MLRRLATLKRPYRSIHCQRKKSSDRELWSLGDHVSDQIPRIAPKRSDLTCLSRRYLAENPRLARLSTDLKTVAITGPHALPCRRATRSHVSCATRWLQKVEGNPFHNTVWEGGKTATDRHGFLQIRTEPPTDPYASG
jgi:hypothetical protein